MKGLEGRTLLKLQREWLYLYSLETEICEKNGTFCGISLIQPMHQRFKNVFIVSAASRVSLATFLLIFVCYCRE